MSTVITRWVKSSPQTTEIATAINNTLKLSVSTNKHYAQSEVVLTYSTLSGSDAAATAAAIAAANDVMGVYLFHLADTVMHKAAGTAPALTKATSLATAITLANAIKADYNTHIGDTGLHPNADATNTIAASDATVLSDLQTLLNEMLNTTGIAQHLAAGLSTPSIRVVNG